MKFDVAIWGTVAEWVSGIGTLVAVSVALYLGVRRAPEHFDTELYYYPPENKPGFEQGLLLLDIHNTGDRAVTIRDATIWNGYLVEPDPDSTPHRLQPGEELQLGFRAADIVWGPREDVNITITTGRGAVRKVPVFTRSILHALDS